MRVYTSLAVLSLVLLAGLDHGAAESRNFSSKDIEIKRFLERMNQPAVKTIKSPTGELIDCVDIYRQPSLDHPLLRNHTIQMDYSVNATDIDEKEASSAIQQAWHISGKCLQGTIPIRRIQKHDILRASLVKNFGKKYPNNYFPLLQPRGHPAAAFGSPHEHSVVFTSGGTYFGATADINCWNPRVAPDEFSVAQIWVGSDDLRSSVQAGIMVNPTLYGDSKTRLYTYSTSDDDQNTDCGSLLCHGFVQTNTDIALGAEITPLSTYGGAQRQLIIKIVKDNKSDGNWWLTVQGKPVGYWPNALLPALEGGAKFVEWGGEVYNSNQDGSTNTQMGSGHFAGEGDKKAAYFRNINTFDANGNVQGVGDLQMVVQKPKCYDLILDGGTSALAKMLTVLEEQRMEKKNVLSALVVLLTFVLTFQNFRKKLILELVHTSA